MGKGDGDLSMVNPNEFANMSGINRHSSIKDSSARRPPNTESIDDSLNLRLSNPSEGSSKREAEKYLQLFHQSSNNDDKKSGFFAVNASPSVNEKNPSTGGFNKDRSKLTKDRPAYGL